MSHLLAVGADLAAPLLGGSAGGQKGPALPGEMARLFASVALFDVCGEFSPRIHGSCDSRGRNSRLGALAPEVPWLLTVVTVP